MALKGKDKGKDRARDKDKDREEEEPEPFEVVASELDEMTHAEVRMLYQESTETMRFVKNHQWKTVGATLITYLGIIFVAGFVKADADFANKLMAITILMTCAVIFVLIVYQFWMHNEMAKINRIGADMSNLFSEIRAVKSTCEGNVHRYLLLVFMSIVVVLGAIVVNLALDRISGA